MGFRFGLALARHQAETRSGASAFSPHSRQRSPSIVTARNCRFWPSIQEVCNQYLAAMPSRRQLWTMLTELQPSSLASAAAPPNSSIIWPAGVMRYGYQHICHTATQIILRVPTGCLSHHTTHARLQLRKGAARLRAIMAEFHIATVDELAEIVGANRSAVSNWVNAINLPRVPEMGRLCDKTG